MKPLQKKPRLFPYLFGLGCIFTFLGIYLGFLALAGGGDATAQALRNLALVGIMPLTFCAFLWHTISRGHIIKNQAEFFEIEAGGANLGIGISLLLAWLNHASTAVLAYLLLAYLIYLCVGAICHGLFKSIWSACKFLPLIVLMVFFMYKYSIHHSLQITHAASHKLLLSHPVPTIPQTLPA